MHAGADASVLRRTMSARGGAGLPTAHFLASFVIEKKWNLWMLMIFGGLVQLLSKTVIGAALVLRWPKLLTCGAFSKEGPTQEQIDGTSFVMFALHLLMLSCALTPPLQLYALVYTERWHTKERL
jgi:hypothetical protein